MAVAIVTTPTVASDGTSGTTIAATRTMTAGNSLYVVVSFDISTAQTLSGVSGTVEGAHTVLSSSARDTTNNQGLAHSYKTNHAGGSTTVTATFSATAGARSIALIELSGTSGAPVGHNASFQSAPAAGADVVTSGTFTPTAQPGLLIGVGGNTSIQSPPSAGTGFTDGGTLMDLGLGGGDFFRLESKTISSTASTAATFTRVTANGHCTVAAMFAVPGAGTAVNMPRPQPKAYGYPSRVVPPAFARLGLGLLQPSLASLSATLDVTLGALTSAATVVADPFVAMPLPQPMSYGYPRRLIAPDFPQLNSGLLVPAPAQVNSNATLTATLGALTSVATATVDDNATLAVTLGALTSAATATVANNATLTATLGALTVVSTATGDSANLTLAVTLDALTSVATATVDNNATLTGTLGALTVSSAATVANNATLTATLGALTSSSTATVAVTATASVTLGALTVAAVAINGINNAALAVTLGALTLNARIGQDAASTSIAAEVGTELADDLALLP